MLLPTSLLFCPCPMPSSNTTSPAAAADGEQQPMMAMANNQRARADPFLADMARGMQCCFAGIPHAKDQERQQNFLQSAQIAKKLHIAIPGNGLNLHLNLCSSNFPTEQNEVNFQSDFLFNGILVRLRGQINSRTLAGNTQIEPIPNRRRTETATEAVERERWERLDRRLAHLREAALRL